MHAPHKPTNYPQKQLICLQAFTVCGGFRLKKASNAGVHSSRKQSWITEINFCTVSAMHQNSSNGKTVIRSASLLLACWLPTVVSSAVWNVCFYPKNKIVFQWYRHKTARLWRVRILLFLWHCGIGRKLVAWWQMNFPLRRLKITVLLGFYLFYFFCFVGWVFWICDRLVWKKKVKWQLWETGEQRWKWCT